MSLYLVDQCAIISHVLCNYLIAPVELPNNIFLDISKRKFQRIKRTRFGRVFNVFLLKFGENVAR